MSTNGTTDSTPLVIGSNDNEPLSSLASDFQKTWQALTIAAQQKAGKSCDALVAAEAATVYGDKYKPPVDDVVNVDSPSTTTITHNYPPPQPASATTAKPLHPFAVAAMTAALLASGAGLGYMLRPASTATPSVTPPAQTTTSPAPAATTPATPPPAYKLDFYEPLPPHP